MPFIAALLRIYVASRRGGAVALFEASGVPSTKLSRGRTRLSEEATRRRPYAVRALQPTRTSQPVITLCCGSDRQAMVVGPGHESKRLSPRTKRLELVRGTTRAAPHNRIERQSADERLTDSLHDAIAGFPVLSRATRNGLAYRRQFDAQLLDKCRHFRIRQQLKVGDPVFLRPAIGHGFGPGHCGDLRSRYRWMNY